MFKLKPQNPVLSYPCGLKSQLVSVALIIMLGVAWPQPSYAQVATCPGPPPLTTTDSDGDGYDDNIDVFPKRSSASL